MTASAQPGPNTTQKPRRRPRAYEDLPTQLPRATEFTDDPELCDPVWVIEELKRHPDVLDQLLADTDVAKRYGRRRLPGKWALVMLAFTLSGEVDVEPFCNRYASSPLWQAAGFSEPPSSGTVWNRLIELEPHAQAFVDAANKLIRRAIQHEPEVGRWVWVDGSAFHTHAKLEHCCPDRDACRAIGGAHAQFPARVSDEFVTEARHEESAEVAGDESEKAPGALEEISVDEKEAARSPKRRRPYRYFEIGGHRFRSLDPDAGARMYGGQGKRARKKFWFGGLHQSGVSIYAGAPLAINLLPANEHEFAGWPTLLTRMREATGQLPEAVVMDRAYSFKSVFELNTRQGIASVIGWRKWKPDMKREQCDTDDYDRHGVPRCRHCGGPGDIESAGLGFYKARGNPRLRFRCMLGNTLDCAKTQSISCSQEWRLLVPMSRRSKTYHSLRKCGKTSERIFRHWRDRYSVAGNSIDSRPKRPGLAWQNLRSSAALLLEWFRLSLRRGWLGSHRNQNREPAYEIKPGDSYKATLATRRKYELDLPYGTAAVQCGYRGGGAPDDDPDDDNKLPF